MKRKTFNQHLKENLLKTLNTIFKNEDHVEVFNLKVREPFSSIQTCHNFKDRIFVQELYLDIELNSKCFLLKAYEDVIMINYHFHKFYENYVAIKPLLEKGLRINISSLLFFLFKATPEIIIPELTFFYDNYQKESLLTYKIVNDKKEEITINEI